MKNVIKTKIGSISFICENNYINTYVRGVLVTSVKYDNELNIIKAELMSKYSIGQPCKTVVYRG